MGLEQTDYKGNENIGFYGVVSDTYAVFTVDFKTRDLFDNHCVKDIRIGGTDLIGLFATGNSNGLVVPDLVRDHEAEQLRDSDVPFHIVEDRYTAIGNLILCNDTGCIISPHLEDHRDAIADGLDVPVETGTVAGLNIPGSCGVATNKGVLLHRDATEDELAHVEDVLGVDADIGSVNFGSPYVHSGILANSTDLLIGPNTTGPETQRIQDALGFL